MSSDIEGYDELRQAAAMVESRATDWLRLTGADRLRFANGLVTCDLKALGTGDGTYGFFTDPKGRVLADAAFLARESDLLVELPAGCAESIGAHLRRYVVADRVEVEALEGWRTVFVAGPEAKRWAKQIGGDVPSAPWSGTSDLEAVRGPLVIRAERRLGVAAWVIAGPPEALEVAVEQLRESGLADATAAATGAVRVEEGIPWFGVDFGPAVEGGASFPQETGLESWAVSFEKGCYLGQEVIARIHFRGKVNRSLRGLVFEPGSTPRAGSKLSSGGETVAVLTSVEESPARARPLGLAIVHHKAEVGSELVTEEGLVCGLVDLPFAGALET